MMKKDFDAFINFIEALKDVDQSHVADQLQNTLGIISKTIYVCKPIDMIHPTWKSKPTIIKLNSLNILGENM